MIFDKDDPYKPIPCGCGHPSCEDWHVDPVAVIQGVNLSKRQAYAVAALLNAMEGTHDK